MTKKKNAPAESLPPPPAAPPYEAPTSAPAEALPARLVPVATTHRELAKRIRGAFAQGDDLEPVFFYTRKACLDHLIYETPDLVVLHFADDKLNTRDLLQSILADRWLNCAGLIAIHNQKEDEFLKTVPGGNLVAVLHEREIEVKLPRILGLIRRNRNILFQREFQAMFTGELSGAFAIDNDLLDLQVHVNLIVNLVYNAGHIDESVKQELKLVLHELLINAVEHGNLDISFDEKTGLTREGFSMSEIIAERVKAEPEKGARKVHLNYRISPEKTAIVIRDEGKGFDWKSRQAEEPDENSTLLHGRGIQMSRSFCRNLQWNERGNQVSFEFLHRATTAPAVPAFFEEGAMTRFRRGQVVFRRGEESNFLYYIASGRYQILDEKGTLLSTLGPGDAFLGEMSFLLNNRRTASVMTTEEGVLYRISKNRFIAAMQRSPYYAFFLCKLLARRLSDANERIARRA